MSESFSSVLAPSSADPAQSLDAPRAGARIVVLLAHPSLRTSRVNRCMLAQLAPSMPSDVQIRDIYALYPDYSIDVPLEQSVLQAAELIVLQHPMYWYSMPALLKLYIDDVFTEGWAYGDGSHALASKDLWLAISAGSSAEPDVHGQHRRFERCLPPYRQIAEQCGMRFLSPFVIHADTTTRQESIDAHAARYAHLIGSYPDWSQDAPSNTGAAN